MREEDQQLSAESEFVSLLTGFQPVLHAYLTSLLPGRGCVEDVLQQTNMIIWQKRNTFTMGTNFGAWAFSIARWETKAWLTREKRGAWLSFTDELADRIADQFGQASEHPGALSTLDSLRECLAKLKEKDRQLVISYYQQDRSLGDCARIFKRNAESLKVTLFRIRQLLRRCVDAQQFLNRVQA